jgi:cobyrinic acid a,c-diamide synthase
VAGVIANRVGSERHAQLIEEALCSSDGPPLLGYLARRDELVLPERHLGLVPTMELGRWREWLAAVEQRVAAHVDLDALLALAQAAPALQEPAGSRLPLPVAESVPMIAVAHDEAFHFVYPDNLDLLGEAGGDVRLFSPLHDSKLPEGAQALYLCGGFPELYAAQLSANHAMRTAVQAAFRSGMPIYAECGGLMYLTEAIEDQQGASHAMVGALPGRSVMTPRLALGYHEVECIAGNWLFRQGETLRAHEFHYSIWHGRPAGARPLYRPVHAVRSPWPVEGVCDRNLVASYLHLHFLARPELALRFVAAAAGYVPDLGRNGS